MKKVFIRSGFNYDGDSVSNETGLSCGDESRAIQSAKDTCDINTIVRRFGVGVTASASAVAPRYEDFSEVVDFKSAMDAVARAGEAFDAFPSAIRAHFQNDPQRMLAFVENDSNYDEAIKLGLVKPRAAPVAPQVTPGPEPAKPAPG